MRFIKLLITSLLLFISTALSAQVIISEVIEGTDFNQAIEITNLGDDAVPAEKVIILLYSNGASSPNDEYKLSESGLDILSPGDSFYVAEPNASIDLTANADDLDLITQFNGNDAIALSVNSEIVDVFGKIGDDPGDSWVVGGGSTENHTLIRNKVVCQGSLNWSNAGVEWVVTYEDNFDAIGSHLVRDCNEPEPSLIWVWSFASEQGLLITDGEWADTQSANTFTLYAMDVMNSLQNNAIGNYFYENQPLQGFEWDGMIPTEFYRSNGNLTNGSNYSSRDFLRYGFQPAGADSFFDYYTTTTAVAIGGGKIRIQGPITLLPDTIFPDDFE